MMFVKTDRLGHHEIVDGSGYKMTGTSKDGTYVEWEAPFIDSAGMMAPESAKPVSGISWQPI